MRKNKGKFILGAAIGAAIGMLFAPKSGKENRKIVKAKLDELIESVKDLDKEDLKNKFYQKIDDIKKELEDLDKEKAVKIVQEKTKELGKKAEDLYKLAKEKGTPVLEKTAKSVLEKVNELTKNAIKKLDK